MKVELKVIGKNNKPLSDKVQLRTQEDEILTMKKGYTFESVNVNVVIHFEKLHYKYDLSMAGVVPYIVEGKDKNGNIYRVKTKDVRNIFPF